MEDLLIKEFYRQMEGVDLNVYGLLDSGDRIHTLGTHSKIIGRVFEMFASRFWKRSLPNTVFS